ncbi:hypothetical protein EGW08_006035 [Elysia chlorotica]|uniref:C2H2-type domain-containing protein n=1 Tax=Elysia chlorotica TaxID=188477 RepID=A0A433TX76_ELYCH|nr:hypothetical protein EGW08_006035 [Elysia chlorotica]
MGINRHKQQEAQEPPRIQRRNQQLGQDQTQIKKKNSNEAASNMTPGPNEKQKSVSETKSRDKVGQFIERSDAPISVDNVPSAIDSALAQTLPLMVVDTALESKQAELKAESHEEDQKPEVKSEQLEITAKTRCQPTLVETEIDDVKPNIESVESLSVPPKRQSVRGGDKSTCVSRNKRPKTGDHLDVSGPSAAPSIRGQRAVGSRLSHGKPVQSQILPATSLVGWSEIDTSDLSSDHSQLLTQPRNADELSQAGSGRDRVKILSDGDKPSGESSEGVDSGSCLTEGSGKQPKRRKTACNMERLESCSHQNKSVSREISGGVKNNNLKEDQTSQGKEIKTCQTEFTCDICGKSFLKKKYLKVHLQRHSTEKDFECSLCGKRFTTKQNLQQHGMSHSEEKPFACKLCNKAYKQKRHLERHMLAHTGIKLFECPTCDRAFKEASELMKHKQLHTGEKPYQCDICRKRFRGREVLKGHLRAHVGEKPYVCEICGKGFRRYGERKQHNKVHTGARPYSCDLCGKTFARLNHIQVHVLVHSGAKPFKCDTCGKGFSQKSILTVHRKLHVKDRPFECGICGRSYREVAGLLQHMRKHTGEKPFECVDCGRTFAYLSSLYHHKRRDHKTEAKPS